MNTVFFHRADYDGLFSAAVCQKFLPEGTRLIGWDYGDPLQQFPDEGTVYVVDLSPDLFEGLPDDYSKRLIWIDHHKSSIEKWGGIDEWILGHRIDGVAACRLCWQWFNAVYAPDYKSGAIPIPGSLPDVIDYESRGVHEPLALTLAGEYDVWDLSDPRALPFQYGLTAGGYSLHDGMSSLIDQPREPDITGKWIFPGDAEVKRIVDEGTTALNWHDSLAAQVLVERAYLREWEGLTFCVLGSAHARSSTWFPVQAIPEGTDALMCWRYDGSSVKFSLYHAPGHEQHDLSLIAQKYGGGGHRGACGFELPLDKALEVIR